MSRDEALTAVLNAARALRNHSLISQRSHTNVLSSDLSALHAAIDAVDAVGDLPFSPDLFWCAQPECWRQNDTAGMYCYQHSREAALPSLRRRDAALEVSDD